MLKKLYGIDIPLRTEYCRYFNSKPVSILEPYTNMYVRFKGCNSKCDFCEYINSANNFNIKKYEKILIHIVKNIKLNRFNFTGGEPTMDYEKFKDVFDITNGILDKSTKITINTNGVNLAKLVDDKSIINRVLNISLSRHHYDDNKNNEIFNSNNIGKDEIKDIQKSIKKKDILNFTCNLINNYIDNKEEVYELPRH